MLVCGWCIFDRSIFCSGFLCALCHAAVGCKHMWINVPGLKCLPDGPSVDLTSFSTFHPFLPSLFPCLTALLLQLHSTVFTSSPPSSSSPLLSSPFFQIFYFNVICFPLPPFRRVLYYSLLLYPLPIGNMINTLHFTGYQESIFFLPAWELRLLTSLQLGQLEETLWGIYSGTSCREQRHERFISRPLPVNARELWI